MTLELILVVTSLYLFITIVFFIPAYIMNLKKQKKILISSIIALTLAFIVLVEIIYYFNHPSVVYSIDLSHDNAFLVLYVCLPLLLNTILCKITFILMKIKLNILLGSIQIVIYVIISIILIYFFGYGIPAMFMV